MAVSHALTQGFLLPLDRTKRFGDDAMLHIYFFSFVWNRQATFLKITFSHDNLNSFWGSFSQLFSEGTISVSILLQVDHDERVGLNL